MNLTFGNLLTHLLAILLLASCATRRISRAPCETETKTPQCEKVTINDLHLTYSIEKKQGVVKVLVHTDDAIMVARIMALGLTVTMKEPISEFRSLNYPIGILEVRKFRSPNDFRAFWNKTNIPGSWQGRFSKLFNMALFEDTEGKHRYNIDSNKGGLNAKFKVKNNVFDYELTVPGCISNSRRVDMEISIGRLVLSTPIFENGLRNRKVYRSPSTNYFEYFQSPWEVSVSGC